MPSPLVSVIIPVYNGDRFIGEAIESVLQQTYQNFEIIVVDDGSTDATQAALQPYGDRIHYVLQSNQGVASARNRGVQMARGELIAFLDQDDFFLPNKLALQVSCFEMQPNVGIVHSGWRNVDPKKTPFADIEPWQDAPVLDLAGWGRRMPVLLSAMMFRRNWLIRSGGFTSNFKQASDVELVQQLALMGCEAAWVRQVTVLYRLHDRNDSLNTLIQASETWAVREQFFARSDIPQSIRRIENECLYYTLVWIAWRLYYTGHFTEMAQHLRKSFNYSPLLRTETLLNWINSFALYSSQYGLQFDIQTLSNLVEWNQLINDLVAAEV